MSSASDRVARQAARSLPRDMIREIYARADGPTQVAMKGMARWTQADASMPQARRDYTAGRGARQDLWKVNRSLRKIVYRHGSPDDIEFARFGGVSRAVTRVKQYYKKLRPAERGRRVDARQFLMAALPGDLERYVPMFMSGGTSRRVAPIPEVATPNVIMTRVLEFGAKELGVEKHWYGQVGEVNPDSGAGWRKRKALFRQ